MAHYETITLQYPFSFEKHKDDMEKSICMIADLAEVSPRLVEELDTEDFGMVSAQVGEFMGVSADRIP